MKMEDDVPERMKNCNSRNEKIFVLLSRKHGDR